MRKICGFRHKAAALLAVLTLAPPVSNALILDLATVGNPGNAADALNSGNVAGIGSVGFTFGISKYETTNAQYVEFLNTVDPSGSNSRALYNSAMSTNGNVGGIDFNSLGGSGSKYSVKTGRGTNPVAFVSWYDAARMANWMHNGQGAGSTETGAYTLTGNTTISGGRSANAKFAVPTENEWYKAAYHQPTAAGGDTDGFWLYPTQSNTVPTNPMPAGTDNSANFFTTVFARTQSSTFSNSQVYVTTVGAYNIADSYYGTFDQGGNLFEWNETLIGGTDRGARGSSWEDTKIDLASTARDSFGPTFEGENLGFRLASVPEPMSIAWGGFLMLLLRGKRSPNRILRSH